MQVRLTIQEKLKDLRVERHLTLVEQAEQTGISSSALGKYEADDYVKNILRCFTDKSNSVLLISEDEDWCRWLSDNIHQYMKHDIWDRNTFIENKGYEPTESNIGFAKSFYGDDSDDIIGALPQLPKMYFDEKLYPFQSDVAQFRLDDFIVREEIEMFVFLSSFLEDMV